MSVYLHIHSDYSLMESVITIDSLVASVKNSGFDVAAITDLNTTSGFIEFDEACTKTGIKPIFGLDLDIQGTTGDYRLILLAENQQGYKNLLKLSSLTKPVQIEQLAAYTEGLIAISNISEGEIAALVLNEEVKIAEQAFYRMKSMFGNDNFFIELQTETTAIRNCAKKMIELFPIEHFTAGQKVCYISEDEKLALQALRAIKNNKLLKEIQISEMPLPSSKQFTYWYKNIPQVTANNLAIAQRCNVSIARISLPPSITGMNLRDRVLEGAKARYGSISSRVYERLNYELEIIEKMKYDGYFLIVTDIVNYAKENHIPVGPGRGSAAGSLVAYCLNITDVDPLQYNLVFERFLNEQRNNFPDIDIDICANRRVELLNYVAKRFGSDKVAQIGTFGTFGIRSAVREVGKTLEISQEKLTKMLKNVNFNRKESLNNIISKFKSYPQLYNIVKQLIGIKRNFSVHAAGLVIAPTDISDYCAVYNREGELPVTQFSMESLASLGLLKFDLLSLRTLTLIKETCDLIQTKHYDFKLEKIPFADEKTFSMLTRGKSLGVFQLESTMFQRLLKQLKPKNFHDIVALLALGRPGPLAYIPEYISNRDDSAKLHYSDERLKDILGETFGLMIYQEQVMEVAHKLGNLSLGEADLLRIAMSKKDKQAFSDLKEKFINGCLENGIAKQHAIKIFSMMEQFSGYAFNKAHSVSYALITWQTAFLKANYPHEFFAAHFNNLGNKEKQEKYFSECRWFGIDLFSPDIRYSDVDFTVEGTGLRFGLGHLKNVSKEKIKEIIQERNNKEFISLSDFGKRVSLPKPVLESLILSGALDCFSSRKDLIKQFNVQSLAGDGLSELELLRQEKEIVGVYATDHPISRWKPFLTNLSHGFSNMLLGEIIDIDDFNRKVTGLINTEFGPENFYLTDEAKQFRKFLQKNAWVALFGLISDDTFHVQWVLPLVPILIVQPDNGQFEKTQEILINHSGDTPVILSLGIDAIQLVSPKFWVARNVNLETIFSEQQINATWFDPWNQLKRD